MRKALVLAVLCALAGCMSSQQATDQQATAPQAAAQKAALSQPAIQGAPGFDEKWLYASPNMQDPDSFIELLKESKKSGVTNVLMGDSTSLRPERVTPEYLANVAKVKAALKELGIKNTVNVYPTGYAGRYMGLEPNIAAGLPARNMPFVVKDGKAMPDPSNVPAIANADFEAVKDGKPEGWTVEGSAGLVASDAEVKHGGAASVRFGSLDGLKEENVRVKQTIKVTPFQHYRMTLWLKADNVTAEGEDYVLMLAPDKTRRYSYTAFRFRGGEGQQGGATADWTRFTFDFNTLEAKEIEFSVGASAAKSGTLWIDDITVEPAGTLGVLRGPTKPLAITSADGKTVYEEGKDFAEVVTPRPVERERGQGFPTGARPVRVESTGTTGGAPR